MSEKLWVVSIGYGKEILQYEIVGIYRKKLSDEELSSLGFKYSKEFGGINIIKQEEFDINEELATATL